MRTVRFRRAGETAEGRLEEGMVVTADAEYDVSDVDLRPPCSPTKIIGVGKNYPDHIAEMKEKGLGTGEPPSFPYLFFKPPSSLVGDGDDIEYPSHAENVHYEGEIGVVVGEDCRGVRPAEAFDVLAGYTAVNDVSLRDWAGKEPTWVRHKGLDTFCPVGPAIQTEMKPDIDLETRVNGRVVQKGNTDEMVFSIAELVADISSYMTLMEGDIIATGTPSGVGPLSPGDVVEVNAEGVGTLRNEVVES